jgi:hypothetical protein
LPTPSPQPSFSFLSPVFKDYAISR